MRVFHWSGIQHSTDFMGQVTKDIYECEGGLVTRFPGDITDYAAVLAKKIEAAQREFERQEASKAASGSKV